MLYNYYFLYILKETNEYLILVADKDIPNPK
jgi:hypothetical protein